MSERATGSVMHTIELEFAPALERMGNDHELFREMARMAVVDLSQLVSQLQTAIDQHDRELSARTAHTIKGLGSTFDGHEVRRIAQQMEAASEAGLLSAAGDLTESLRDSVQSLIRKLQPVI